MSLTTLNVTVENDYVPITSNWSTVEKIIAIAATSGINVSAIILNFLLIATIVLTKALRAQPDTILIGNLALSDFLVACCILPFTTVVLVNDEVDPEDHIWTFIGFSNFFFCIASILNLAILSMDQCLNIACPFWYEIYRTRATAISMAICVWVYSGVCALPPLFGISSYSCFIPSTGPCSVYQWSGTNHSVIFTVLVTVLSWGVGVMLLIISNIKIYLVLIKQRKAIQRTMVHLPNCPTKQSFSQQLTLAGNLCGESNIDSSRNALSKDKSGLPDVDTSHNGLSYANVPHSNSLSADVSHANGCQGVESGPSVSIESKSVTPQSQVPCSDTTTNALPLAVVSGPQMTKSDVLNDKATKDNVNSLNVTKIKSRRGTNLSRRRTKGKNRCNCFARTKHVKSLLIIVIAYFITWSPFCILLLIEIQQKTKQFANLSLMFLWVGHMSSFINPALYFYRYSRFREAAKALGRKFVNKVRVHPT